MTTAKRMKIFPADRQQMEDIIASEKDPELKKAYTEILEGFVNCVQSKIKTNKSSPKDNTLAGGFSLCKDEVSAPYALFPALRQSETCAIIREKRDKREGLTIGASF